MSHINEVQNTAIRKKLSDINILFRMGFGETFALSLDFGEIFALSLEYCARL